MSEQDTGVPLVDVSAWFGDDDDARAALVALIDRHLQRVGFLVVTGHGVPQDLPDVVRRQGQDFFDLPQQTKER